MRISSAPTEKLNRRRRHSIRLIFGICKAKQRDESRALAAVHCHAGSRSGRFAENTWRQRPEGLPWAGRNTPQRQRKKAAHGTETATKKIADYFGKHPTALMVILLGAMLLVVMSSLQSCSPLVQFVLESIVIGTYPAEDDDVLAAERATRQRARDFRTRWSAMSNIIPAMTSTMSRPRKSGMTPMCSSPSFPRTFDRAGMDFGIRLSCDREILQSAICRHTDHYDGNQIPHGTDNRHADRDRPGNG